MALMALLYVYKKSGSRRFRSGEEYGRQCQFGVQCAGVITDEVVNLGRRSGTKVLDDGRIKAR